MPRTNALVYCENFENYVRKKLYNIEFWHYPQILDSAMKLCRDKRISLFFREKKKVLGKHWQKSGYYQANKNTINQIRKEKGIYEGFNDAKERFNL